MKFVITIFAIGILLRLVMRYIIPIFHFTTITNERLRQMRDQMQEMDRKANESNNRNKTKKEGDYIDYEEVR